MQTADVQSEPSAAVESGARRVQQCMLGYLSWRTGARTSEQLCSWNAALKYKTWSKEVKDKVTYFYYKCNFVNFCHQSLFTSIPPGVCNLKDLKSHSGLLLIYHNPIVLFHPFENTWRDTDLLLWCCYFDKYKFSFLLLLQQNLNIDVCFITWNSL